MTTTMPSPAPTADPGELPRPVWATHTHEDYDGVYHTFTAPTVVTPEEAPGGPFTVELAVTDKVRYDERDAVVWIGRNQLTVWVGCVALVPDEARRLQTALGEVLAALDASGGDQ